MSIRVQILKVFLNIVLNYLTRARLQRHAARDVVWHAKQENGAWKIISRELAMKYSGTSPLGHLYSGDTSI